MKSLGGTSRPPRPAARLWTAGKGAMLEPGAVTRTADSNTAQASTTLIATPTQPRSNDAEQLPHLRGRGTPRH